MTDSIIKITDLKRTFRLSRKTTVQALKGVSCELRRGTCLAVVGESGSGKSTIAKIVVGLETVDSGTVQIDGAEIQPTQRRSELKRRAKQVQMVFQDPNGSLNRSLPVGKTIAEMLQVHCPELDKKAREDRVAELFREVGLEPQHAAAKPSQLSGGQKQRVAIARALAADPEVIVLDEAVSALDVSVQAQILELLQRLRAEHNLSYLFITHDLSVVREIADDVIVMRSGEIVERGTVGEVLDTPQHPYTKLLIESAPRPGWVPQRGLRKQLLEA